MIQVILDYKHRFDKVLGNTGYIIVLGKIDVLCDPSHHMESCWDVLFLKVDVWPWKVSAPR